MKNPIRSLFWWSWAMLFVAWLFAIILPEETLVFKQALRGICLICFAYYSFAYLIVLWPTIVTHRGKIWYRAWGSIATMVVLVAMIFLVINPSEILNQREEIIVLIVFIVTLSLITLLRKLQDDRKRSKHANKAAFARADLSNLKLR